ncbi:MAG: hypothetical protein ACK5Z2_07495 [Bacteroidota bacterium]|jgi:hypothetical protein
MTPTTLKTGSSDVMFTLITLDNYITVDINPDGIQGGGTMGWNRVLEMNNAGFGPAESNNGLATIDLTPYLTAYQQSGAKSVNLAIVVSNWTGGGSVKGTITWPGNGSENFENLDIPSWSSTQLAYTLVL